MSGNTKKISGEWTEESVSCNLLNCIVKQWEHDEVKKSIFNLFSLTAVSQFTFLKIRMNRRSFSLAFKKCPKKHLHLFSEMISYVPLFRNRRHKIMFIDAAVPRRSCDDSVKRHNKRGGHL